MSTSTTTTKPPGPGRGRKKASAAEPAANASAPATQSIQEQAHAPNGAAPATVTASAPAPALQPAPGSTLPAAAPVPSPILAQLEAQIARAASIGRSLQAINSTVMAGLPPGASDAEIGLYLVQTNLDRFEGAVRILEMPLP